MRRWAVLVALLLAGCGGSDTDSTDSTDSTTSRKIEERTMAGTVLLRQINPMTGQAGERCLGFGGYQDINSGAPVLVKDDAGKTIGSSRLEDGQTVAAGTPGQANDVVQDMYCEFNFSVGPLPRRPFYEVSVSHRDGITYSAAELENDGWKVELTLGTGE